MRFPPRGLEPFNCRREVLPPILCNSFAPFTRALAGKGDPAHYSIDDERKRAARKNGIDSLIMALWRPFDPQHRPKLAAANMLELAAANALIDPPPPSAEKIGNSINRPDHIRILAVRLAKGGRSLALGYEARPCGYGRYRQMIGLVMNAMVWCDHSSR